MTPTDTAATLKLCRRCKERKTLDHFAKQKGGKFGVRGQCRTCHKAYYQANRDRILARHKAYHEKHREERVVWMREYARNRDRGKWQEFFRRTWKAINLRTVNGRWPQWNDKCDSHYLRKGVRVEMTEDEFRKWCEQRKGSIECLYKAAEEHGDHGLSPSVDRMDSTRHYSIDNIELTSVRLNTRRAHKAA